MKVIKMTMSSNYLPHTFCNFSKKQMLERKLRKISNLKNTFWREVSLGLNLSQLPQNLEIERCNYYSLIISYMFNNIS
jgi:hypothetical protein